MKIIFLQTYAIYHDGLTVEEWLKLENRDKWMPALAAGLGYETELWGVGNEYAEFSYRWSDDVAVPIRLFPADSFAGRTKKHTSRALNNYAVNQEIGHVFLKGVDGAIGYRIIKDVLLPRQIPWSFIVGGEYMSRFNAVASSILCETRHQMRFLKDPGWFRKLISSTSGNSNTYVLPKSVDTRLFRPDPGAAKEWDIITVGRLMDYYKDFSALQSVSDTCRIAVLGGGPAEESLSRKMPEIEWLGHIPHHQIPGYLVKAKAFFHTSFHDHFPRVIPEAAACGIPVIAFQKAIDADVLPPEIGLRIGTKNIKNEILNLLGDDVKLQDMGIKARKHAEKRWHKHSSLPILKTILGER